MKLSDILITNQYNVQNQQEKLNNKNTTMFNDIINKLKKVKTEEDISPDLSFELTAAAITSHMQCLDMQYDDLSHEEALDMTRSMILKQLDGILIELYMNNDDLDDDFGTNKGSPMDDPILNEAIQKAMNEYNVRLEKKPTMKKV